MNSKRQRHNPNADLARNEMKTAMELVVLADQQHSTDATTRFLTDALESANAAFAAMMADPIQEGMADARYLHGVDQLPAVALLANRAQAMVAGHNAPAQMRVFWSCHALNNSVLHVLQRDNVAERYGNDSLIRAAHDVLMTLDGQPDAERHSLRSPGEQACVFDVIENLARLARSHVRSEDTDQPHNTRHVELSLQRLLTHTSRLILQRANDARS